jgi:hypothetical protein
MDRTPSRLDHVRIAKKTFDSKLEGGRRRGRPRLRWLEDVKKNLYLLTYSTEQSPS